MSPVASGGRTKKGPPPFILPLDIHSPEFAMLLAMAVNYDVDPGDDQRFQKGIFTGKQKGEALHWMIAAYDEYRLAWTFSEDESHRQEALRGLQEAVTYARKLLNDA